ncbi:DUF2142 domain-containing protein [Stenotrophomonas sp. PS02289]|uniref:DUF2142 domain-containing protein n=1 Tax=Stenotrophomonas sp. PS02289 TaxID=2991422 RepID=UPI00249BA093|nr:DUF2142 domain-containing protein [Stenotrophomonas sp. PS02289]
MMRVVAQQEVKAPQAWPLFLIAMFMLSLVFSALTPPFQAPDEFDHVKRAYMLGQGRILLDSVNGSPSGGEVDNGLLQYMESFVPIKGVAARKMSSDELLNAGGVKWQGASTFQTPVGTAYYFPLMYAPQAMGLAVGKALDMSVAKSYRLARAFSLFVSMLLLALAFRLYRPSAAVLAILALPMTLFLFGSAVLDPMSTAVAIVAVAAFMRISVDREATAPWVFNVFAASVLLVCACRANMLPLLLLPFVAWWFVRDRRLLYVAIGVAVFALAWTLFTVKTTVYPPNPGRGDHAARLLHLLTHPGELFGILFATWTDRGRMSFYAVSFLGVLGWLDTPFGVSFYRAMGVALAAISLLSISIEGWRENAQARIALIVVSLSAVLMTFLALLVQWTDPTSPTVDGVQGRYLVIPAICLLYALTTEARPRADIRFYATHALLALFLCVGAYATASILVQRYHTAAAQPELPMEELKPSPGLTREDAVELHLLPAQEEDPEVLTSIAVRFGTYMTQHAGQAKLRMWTDSGEATEIPFELSELVDNEYREFPLDGKRYVGGEIKSISGDGVSVWESRDQEDTATSCVLLKTAESKVRLPRACPRP